MHWYVTYIAQPVGSTARTNRCCFVFVAVTQNAVSVGNEAKKDAPTIGAPLKTDVEMSALKVRRSRIRKPCKKCQERLKKIRARMAKRAAMSIDKDDTNVTNNNNVMA